MSDAHGGGGHSGPGTLETLVDDLERGLKTPEHFAHELHSMHLPVDKQGKVDYISLIRQISEKGKGYAAHNKVDPLQATPTDGDIKTLLESEGIIEEGHLTQAGVNSLVSLYTQGATNYANGRFQNGMLRSSVESDKKDGETLAVATANYDAISEIKKAKDQEGVVRALAGATRDLLDKVGNAAARGKLKSYLDGIKPYLSGQGHGAHAPAYSH